MAQSKVVGLLFEAWKDFDRALEGLTAADAVKQHFDGSSFAWTYAHTTNQVDAWVNVRFQEREPHPLLSHNRFGLGVTGAADDWDAIQQGVREVRHAARSYLADRTDEDLDVVIPYLGSFKPLHGTGISLRYAVYRAIAHHYFHLGEVASKRDLLGHGVGDHPGPLEESI